MDAVQMYITYPVADKLPKSLRELSDAHLSSIKARWTGKKRNPRRGEWYLSGAVIEAYQAYSDLDDSYPIAELVEVETITTHVVRTIEPLDEPLSS